jgi:hypothetical protein
MLLTKKKRQEYLKALGYYNGAIDGIEGTKTKKAYKDLQKDYFARKKDIDGKYGKNTDILLRSAYNCKDLKYFKLNEFKCQCKGLCTGYPTELKKDLVVNLDALRDHYGKATKIESGLRCNQHNKNVGGSNGSRHKAGKAVDIYITGVSNTLKGRKGIVDYWIETYKTSRYAYCNGYARTKSKTTYPTVKTMGTSVHVDVK